MAFQQPFSLCALFYLFISFLDGLLRSSSDRITSMARMGLKKNGREKGGGAVFGKERQEFCGVNLFRRCGAFVTIFGCMMQEAG